MALKIEFESVGLARRSFVELRDELIAAGKKFDRNNLCWIAYSELYLCAIGNAGPAACSLKLVVEEKRQRRKRFITLSPEELFKCEPFLSMEGMWEDVLQEAATKAAPKWEELSTRQQAWMKLNCLATHLDHPERRLGEVILLLKDCSVHHDLPPEVATSISGKIKQAAIALKDYTQQEFVRGKLRILADTILDFLPDNERSICEREELQTYSCTSDCYRVLS